MDETFNKFFPFHKLGLRKNPFGALTPDEWVAVTVLPQVIHDILATDFDHLQIIGERGRGKSTTLRWLCHHFESQGQLTAYERLPRWQFNYHSNISNLDCFALDEAQRLFILNQRRLFHETQGKRLIIGTHVGWERAFRFYDQQLTTIHIADHTTRNHIQQVLQKRLQVFSLDGDVHIYFNDSAIDYLWEQWRDNLRGMEWFLYHVIQKCRTKGAITADYLKSAGSDYKEPQGLY